jgi:hypothetical protein
VFQYEALRDFDVWNELNDQGIGDELEANGVLDTQTQGDFTPSHVQAIVLEDIKDVFFLSILS